MSGEPNLVNTLSDQLREAVAKAGESTVLVNARRRLPASGIAYASDLILTADHVIEKDEGLSIVLPDGSTVQATIAGRDPGTDLALLRLEKASAVAAERSTQERGIGEIVLALGRPSQQGIEASIGIISAIGGPVRTGRGGLLERYLRTDAIPFPGFSGGPLIDTRGKVIGLNTSGLAHGAAITIPASLAWSSAEDLAKFGYAKRGYLGIRSQAVPLSADLRKALGREQESGLLIVSVEPGSPAEAGGMMVGDILVGLEGHPVSDHDELFIHLTGEAAGKQAAIQLLRGGKPVTIQVTVGERK